MEENIKVIIEQFVDFLSPEFTPYEASVYLYLLRNSFLRDGVTEVRVGKRTIATGHGKPQRGEQTAYHHMSEVLKNLEEKGCIKNEQKPTNDIDILVEFEKGKVTFDNYMDLKFFLEDLFKCKVDLVMHDALKPDLKPYILGSVKYAASA